MARSRNSFPSYLEHKQSGKGRAVWTDGAGQRHYRMMPGVFEVVLAYLEHAKTYYIDDEGANTKELGCMKAAIKSVLESYGELSAVRFGPLALKAVRQRMIETGLCRGLINRRIDRVKRVFKWAAAEELISVSRSGCSGNAIMSRRFQLRSRRSRSRRRTSRR